MKNILPIKNKEKDMEENQEDNKRYEFVSIERLKESFNGWIDNIVNNEGSLEAGYKIENGIITLRVYDTFITANTDGGKRHYEIVVENITDEVNGNQEVIN